jgi:hypothetical protein
LLQSQSFKELVEPQLISHQAAVDLVNRCPTIQFVVTPFVRYHPISSNLSDAEGACHQPRYFSSLAKRCQPSLNRFFNRRSSLF